jgi:aminopeptidase N
VDKEDGSEYIYSLFVPSDASTAFPVFDQPDLKARFQLTLNAPGGWKPVTNTALNGFPIQGRCFTELLTAKAELLTPKRECLATFFFHETKPISTYVFAFAAGPFEPVSDSNAAVTAAVPGASRSQLEADRLQDSQRDAGVTASIYVRKSQAAKFIPHADEAFRLNREAVKYFEQYFDYKFPFRNTIWF